MENNIRLSLIRPSQGKPDAVILSRSLPINHDQLNLGIVPRQSKEVVIHCQTPDLYRPAGWSDLP